jgi:hypothetical protein
MQMRDLPRILILFNRLSCTLKKLAEVDLNVQEYSGYQRVRTFGIHQRN